tara:strand:+ start:620 stop:1264 length:645 start_codon:yes stop_codon:yes gene_type:complete
MFVLNDKTVLQPGKSWKDDDGLQHPSNWATAWSTDEKTARGIKEVAEEIRPDDKFYRVTGFDLNGKWSSSPKDLEDIKESGVVVSIGLKNQWIEKTKKTANNLLADTDWQVIAKAERDRAIDSDVATYRAAVITACTAIRKSITDITDTAIPSGYDAAKEKTDPTDAEKKIISDYETEVANKFAAFKALFDAPVDSNGKPTGNAPMYDWPVMGE